MAVESVEEMQISPVLLLAHIIKRRLFTWSVGSVRPQMLILLLLGQPCVSQQGLKSLELGI